eukprot:4346291-Lingulodinium_polyedra.AAC.1
MVPSCIFALPGVDLEMVAIDVLHAVDLGVAQDAIGNALWEFLHSACCAGANLKEKAKQTWMLLKDHYKQVAPPTRLQNLTLEMIRQPGKPPKLRAKGAETRCMIGFAAECAHLMQKASPT